LLRVFNMRIVQIFASLALAVSAANAVSVPEVNALDTLEHARVVRSADILSPDHALEKRKGGGGKGGGGSGGSGGGRSSGGGGGSRGGSGPPRSYGGGKYYGGGASRPFRSGGRTPKGLVAGALIAPAAILLIMPGLWLYSVYPYHYNNPYRFRNMTRNGTDSDNNNGNTRRQEQAGVEETLPVTCLCQENSDCGCDENDDAEYLDSLVGNGSYAALNKTLVTVSDINGTRTLVINGTLPEGTTAPDESGAVMRINRYTGYWVMVMIVVSIVTYL
jgi:hypothetical protein